MAYLSGTRLVYLVIAATFIGVAGTVLSVGTYTGALPYVMKPTAHVAFGFFFMAFTASSFNKLAPSAYSKWAMRNRRYIGLSFASIHFIHAGLVLSNLDFTGESREFFELAGGGFAYLLLLLMAITSNNASIKALGAKNWKRLHFIGSWYIWIIFSLDIPLLFTGENLGRAWISILCITALVMRISTYVQEKRTQKA